MKPVQLCYFSLLLLSLLVISSKTVFAEQWLEKKDPVEIDKSWVITFNTKIDKQSIRPSMIQIVNDRNTQIPLTLAFNKESTKVFVTPTTPYKLGEVYYLVVSDEIKSMNRKKLKQGVKMKFTTKAVKVYSDDLNITGYNFPNGIFEKDTSFNAAFEVLSNANKQKDYLMEYILEDPNGLKIKVNEKQITLNPNESQEITLNGSLSTQGNIISGKYTPSILIREKGKGKILAHIEKQETFSIFNHIESFELLNEELWEIRDSFLLGRGNLLKENVTFEKNVGVSIFMDRIATSGGEIRTTKKMKQGSFQARMKVANAPGSITGFFLYSPPDFFHEIDIEIFNDSTGTVLFTVYKDGGKVQHEKRELGFDPTAEFHEYRFDVYEKHASFYIDDKMITKWDGSYGSAPMQLMINSWYPVWLNPENVIEPPKTIVEEVRY